MALESMTGFATAEGETEGARWRWEARSVNGKGLDLRLRLPEGFEAKEPEIRKRAGAALSRGNATLTLRIERAETAAKAALDPDALAAAVAAASEARRVAEAAGLPTAPVAPERLIAAPGVFSGRGDRTQPDPALEAAVLRGLDEALAALASARRGEGAAVGAALAAILDQIAARAGDAEAAHADQRDAAAAKLREKIAAVMEAGADVSEDRLAQELALIAVRADVREELDRLAAHVEAARALLAEGGAVGRRLDFLTQEFNREANTLCSKSASSALTDAGLALKVLIDQLREQAQNLA